MDIFTTDAGELADTGQVDMGYHYSIDELLAPIYGVTVSVVGGHGSAEVVGPASVVDGVHAYYAGTDVTLSATPEPGYRVATWTALDEDTGWNLNTLNEPWWNVNSIDLTMNCNRIATVEFEPVTGRILKVPQEFGTIELAVADANNGDIIFVSKGTHYISDPNGIDFRGKSISLLSTDPNDPEVVAQTVIDCQGTKYYPKRAFQFHSGEEPSALVEGFTIINGIATGPIGLPGREWVYYPIPYQSIDPDNINDVPKAERGKDALGDGYGGAILCSNGSSPTITKCVITDNFVTGAVGGMGAYGTSTGDGLPDEWYYIPGDLTGEEQSSVSVAGAQWGGDGGYGAGIGYGGAFACIEGSSPIIRHCILRNNAARGGWGGTGGLGGDSENSTMGWGGNGGTSYGGGVGGAIYCDDRSLPIIEDCNFIDNFATTGPIGVAGAAGSGAPLNPDTETGFDGYAYNNYFGFGFGIGSGFGYIEIAGGAIYYDEDSDANLVNCEFSGNKAYDTYTGYDRTLLNLVELPWYTIGGAVYSVPENDIVINNCDFTANLGGAVYCATGCELDFDDCLFEQNSSVFTGGIFYYVPYYVSYGAFTGGAIYVPSGGYADIDNCADFKDCEFGGNSAGGNGGAIEAYYDTGDPNTHVILRLNFEACGFTANKAVDDIYSYGGAVHFQDFDATFKDCYFLRNTAKSGGALFLTTGRASFDGGFISENRALGASGFDTSYVPLSFLTSGTSFYSYGLYADVTAGTTSTAFDMVGRFGEAHWLDLSATVSIGGGIVFADADGTIENMVFQDNVVETGNGAGGAINFYGGGVEHLIKNCLLIGNSAEAQGGAIASAIYSKPEIQNCTFADNFAGKIGGA